ncbi:MAG: hypothetical protein U5K32_00725 [Bacteroidales bacterium]|nr:hypothetical protein [Bacteroidales bacterium]
MAEKKYILVIRLSAMGDVALSVPVIRAADTGSYKVLVLTRPSFAGFFSNIEGLEVFSAETGGRHKGLPGIIRLYREINSLYNIKMVIDLHSVLRTWLLGLIISFKGYQRIQDKQGKEGEKRIYKIPAEKRSSTYC